LHKHQFVLKFQLGGGACLNGYRIHAPAALGISAFRVIRPLKLHRYFSAKVRSQRAEDPWTGQFANTATSMAHILVIDDDPHMRALLRRVLENDGHSVTLANDGEDALTLVDSSVELVITDILMPQLAVSKQLNF
jgi:hypothetical protein